MGLFKLLKKWFARPKSDPLEQMIHDLDSGRPRCHHYTFAHIALRQLAFQDPINCLGALASPNATEILCALWSSVDQHCQEQGESSTINPREMVIHSDRINGFPCAILEMPEPWFVSGAWYVALVVLLRSDEELLAASAKDLRYFTLEKGAMLDGSERTVFCAWTEEGSHLNFGDGPPPDLDSFLSHLEDHLTQNN